MADGPPFPPLLRRQLREDVRVRVRAEQADVISRNVSFERYCDIALRLKTLQPKYSETFACGGVATETLRLEAVSTAWNLMLDIILVLFGLKKFESDARKFIERAADDTPAREGESSGFSFKKKFFFAFLTKTAKFFFQKKVF